MRSSGNREGMNAKKIKNQWSAVRKALKNEMRFITHSFSTLLVSTRISQQEFLRTDIPSVLICKHSRVTRTFWAPYRPITKVKLGKICTRLNNSDFRGRIYYKFPPFILYFLCLQTFVLLIICIHTGWFNISPLFFFGITNSWFLCRRLFGDF
jgi:hypothetical protein